MGPSDWGAFWGEETHTTLQRVCRVGLLEPIWFLSHLLPLDHAAGGLCAHHPLQLPV